MTIFNLRISYAITIGAVAFAVAFVLGTPLNIAIGAAMGGLINSVITAVIITIGCKALERFPYATIIWVAFSIPAILTQTMGPAGIHKPLIALVTGLVMELSFLLLGRRSFSYFVVGFITSITMTLCILGSMFLLEMNIESASALMSKLWFILPIYGTLGGFGMYLGARLFEARFKDIDFVQRIMINRTQIESTE